MRSLSYGERAERILDVSILTLVCLIQTLGSDGDRGNGSNKPWVDGEEQSSIKTSFGFA
jgi:hypothetical protein